MSGASSPGRSLRRGGAPPRRRLRWRSTLQRCEPGTRRVMKVVQIPNGQFVQNAYLVIDEATAECAVIDPGEEAGLIAQKLRAAGARPVAIWVTHAHLD